MTCKDCIHYTRCAYALDSGADNACEDFKDKSRFIELPCKIGDVLYRIWNVESKNRKPQISIRRIQLNQNNFWRIVFGGEFGKTVFTTQEAAEKAVKALNRDGESEDD